MLKAETVYSNAFCDLPSTRIKINVAGEVAMCCYMEANLGNVLTSSIESIWNSPLAKDIRRVTNENRLHRCCTAWKGCPFQGAVLKPRAAFATHPYLPTSIELDLPSTHCNIGGTNPDQKNQACVMCPRSFPEFRQNRYWSLNNTDRILDAVKVLMPTLKDLCILGVAEPFWKDILFAALAKLDFAQYKQQVFFWTTTNGSLFHEKNMLRYLATVGASNLMVSIDAGTPTTYIRIRRLDFFDVIKRNLKLYSQTKPPEHRLSIHNTISTLNAHEMVLMVEFAKEVGADDLTFNPVHKCGLKTGPTQIMVTHQNLPVFQDSYAMAAERASEIGVSLRLYRPFAQAIHH